MRLVPTIAAVLLLSPLAAGAQTASVEVMVVQASKQEGPTDPRIGPLRKQFADFAYRSFQVLSQQQVDVTEGGTQTVSIPGGKTLTIRFTKRDKDGKARLALEIPAVVKSTVSLAPGGTVMLGGPAMPHGPGVLFVPVKLTRVK